MSRSDSQVERGLLDRLIQAARLAPPSAGESPGRPAAERNSEPAEEYDWNVPHHFTSAEIEKANSLAAQAAAEASARLGELLRADVLLEAAPVAEHYARDLVDSAAGAAEYRIAVAADELGQCGLIALWPDRAAVWVEKLLGSSAPVGGGEKELSALETDLLLDIVGVLAEAFSVAFKAAGGRGLSHAREIVKDDYPLGADEAAEYCKIVFREGVPKTEPNGEGEPEESAGDQSQDAGEPQSEGQQRQEAEDKSHDEPDVSEGGPSAPVALVILSELLEPAVRADAPAGANASAEQTREAILGHVMHVPLTATARLGRAPVKMRDIIALEEGDVLLIGRRADEPADLIVEGREILSGFPVVSGGRKALRVVGPSRRGREGEP